MHAPSHYSLVIHVMGQSCVYNQYTWIITGYIISTTRPDFEKLMLHSYPLDNRDDLDYNEAVFVTFIKTVLVTVLTRVTKFILWANEKVFLQLSTVTHLN